MTTEELEQAFEKELIQTAAVCVAALEDLIFGSASNVEAQTNAILNDVHKERFKQNKKWGAQHHRPTFWMTILGEEFGEASRAALHLEPELGLIRKADGVEKEV